jgi:hypothetical protein
MKATKISMIKRILSGNCKVALGDVPHIGFIGRSIAEFHVYVDKAIDFKMKVTKTIPSIQFIELDPLDPALFKDDSVVEKAKEASTKVIKRLEKRFNETPITGHRRFLSGLLSRAKEQAESGKYSVSMTIAPTEEPKANGEMEC